MGICGDDGVPVFDRLRYGRQPQSEAVLFAFDVLELAGKHLRRTTVTNAARVLQGAGLIRYRRGHIQIVNRPALQEIACECYAVVKHNSDRTFPPLGSVSRPASKLEEV